MKTLFLVLFLICIPLQTFAGGASSAWHDPWAFQTPSEKAFYRNQALTSKLLEEGGFSTSYYSECKNCSNYTSTAIGVVINIEGDNNDVDAENEGDQGAQNNNGKGEINQGGTVD